MVPMCSVPMWSTVVPMWSTGSNVCGSNVDHCGSNVCGSNVDHCGSNVSNVNCSNVCGHTPICRSVVTNFFHTCAID